MDPHKRTVTIEVMTSEEQVVGHGRFTTDAAGYAQMLSSVRAWPERIWAVEGCEGIGRHVAQRLVAGPEIVIDVPAKLSARMRVYATGQGRTTDDTDAHSIALVGVRINGLRAVVHDQQREILRLLVDRRRRIGEDHTRMICQLHRLLLELIPGGAKKDLSAAQARKLLTTVRPTDTVGKTRKRVALELVTDLERTYQRKKAASAAADTSTAATDPTPRMPIWQPDTSGCWCCHRSAAGRCTRRSGARTLQRRSTNSARGAAESKRSSRTATPSTCLASMRWICRCVSPPLELATARAKPVPNSSPNSGGDARDPSTTSTLIAARALGVPCAMP